jgi:hypothetical protein
MTIREIRLDRLGAPLSAERVLDSGRVLGVKRLTDLSGTLLLERGDQPPLLLASDLATRAITGRAAEKLSTPYYLDDDGSVLSITAGIVHLWQSLLDTVPVRSVRFPPGSAFIPSMIPSRDSLGRIQVHYAVPFGASFGGSSGGNAGYFIYRVTEISPARFADPVWAGSRLVTNYGVYHVVTSGLLGVAMRRDCDNQYALVYQLQANWRLDYRELHQEGSNVSSVKDGIDPHGPVSADSMRTGCGMGLPVWIRRAGSKSASEVDLLVGDTIRRLEAPVALLPVNVPDRSPVIMALGGRFLLGYHRMGHDSSMMLASWSIDRSPVMLDSLDVNAGAGAPDGRQGVRTTEQLMGGTEAFLFERRHRWRERTSPTQTVDSQRCTIYLPTGKGWKPDFLKGASSEHSGHNLGVLITASDRRSSELVVVGATIIDFEPSTDLFVVGFDSSGIRKWIVDRVKVNPIQFNLGIAPIGPSNFSLLTYSYMMRFENDSMIRAAEIRRADAARCLPLTGGRVLRWTRLWPARQIELDLLDSNGTRLLSSTAMLPDSAYDPSIIVNPSNSGVVVITGSPTGVQVISIDSSLRTIASARRISETTAPIFHPVGAMVGDRLSVVWQDQRNGVPDIYGASVDTRLLSGVESDTRVSADATLRLYPNPATNLITAAWSITAITGASLELVDILGEKVVTQTIEPGATRVEIETAALPNGLYLLRLTQGARVTTKTIHISR